MGRKACAQEEWLYLKGRQLNEVVTRQGSRQQCRKSSTISRLFSSRPVASAAHPHLALPVDTRLQPKKGHRLAPDMIAAQGGCATFEFDEAVPASVR